MENIWFVLDAEIPNYREFVSALKLHKQDRSSEGTSLEYFFQLY